MERAHAELLASVEAGDEERVRELLEENAEVAAARDAEGASAVLVAARLGQDDILQLLLDANPPLDVHDAAAVGRTRALSELLEADSGEAHKVSSRGETPLHLAAALGQTDAVELLLEHGADPAAAAADGRRPADQAAEAGHEEVAALLREAGAAG